jgi:DNA anti-recombination protein RmuC
MEPLAPPGGARTKLDLLYHEVLGEVAGLVDRLDSVTQRLDAAQQQMQAMADTQQVLPQQLSRHLSDTMAEAAKPIHQQTQHAIQAMLADTHTRLDHLAGEAAQYASIAHQSSRRMALIALVVGGATGVLGGLLAGLALGQHLIS